MNTKTSPLLRYFAPTLFEIPRSFRHKVESFGMGQKNAVALANRLNLEIIKNPNEKWIVFGCAGALNLKFKVGEIFQISSLKEISNESIFETAQNQTLSCTLVSSKLIVTKAESKSKLRAETNADLVDMEMFWLWQSATASTRKNLILIRGVIDEATEDLNFLKPKGGIDPKSFFKPSTIKSFLIFLLHYRKYLRKMEIFLKTYES